MSSSYCCIEVKMPPRLKTTDSLSSKKAEILVPTNNITAWQIHIPYFELQPCGLSQLFSLCSASKLQWGGREGYPPNKKYLVTPHNLLLPLRRCQNSRPVKTS